MYLHIIASHVKFSEFVYMCYKFPYLKKKLFLMAGKLIVYHWPMRPIKIKTKLKLHYKYYIKRGKT